METTGHLATGATTTVNYICCNLVTDSKTRGYPIKNCRGQ